MGKKIFSIRRIGVFAAGRGNPARHQNVKIEREINRFGAQGVLETFERVERVYMMKTDNFGLFFHQFKGQSPGTFVGEYQLQPQTGQIVHQANRLQAAQVNGP